MEPPDLLPDPPVTSADLKLIRDQVDLLQVAAAEKQKPWYKQRPSLASLIALGVSVVTFVISQQGASRQEIRSKQDALRKLLTDVVAEQIEEEDQVARIQDSRKRTWLSSQMNNKRIIWLDAAESLVDQLGQHVSASEFQTSGMQEWNNSEFEKAKQYYVRACDAAKDRFAKTAAFRSLGGFYLQCPPMMRNLEQGREYFEKAVATLGNPTDDYSNYMMGYTYEMWAYGDQSNNLRNERAEHIKRAREYYSTISLINPLRDSALFTLAANNPDLSP